MRILLSRARTTRKDLDMTGVAPSHEGCDGDPLPHHREAGTQVDPDSRLLDGCAFPWILYISVSLWIVTHSSVLAVGIMAGKFNTMNTASFVVCFAFLQFFFNFGANATTYCYPAEVFPTRYRATAHGISAASGKAGAIISSLAFNALSRKIGTPNVMWTVTLTLPEVRGRDPDEVLAQEELEKRAS
ncbi:hypothetical protein EW146_g9874 [Bondarzewia mesenterica]|uniref:Major facilitator superfamily (MFS) profile domain-containing protein n=1 Tax=Bondarzewia mesenterica TaxID=1095465 RepID=A0A4S4L2H8_9AGAM|nr:hypothetical protein EW146_g9874 [Bondarzewia mesenterica]